MKQYSLAAFGLQNLALANVPEPAPGPGEVLLDVRAISLNYRDLLVIRGHYNPKLRLPATPISDAAGVIMQVGAGVADVRAGDRVLTHFVTDWLSGPYRYEYLRRTLGTPGPGLAAERVVLPAQAVAPLPQAYDFAEGATLPIAALTAWSALRTIGRVERGHSVLTLGGGGVSTFALQLAKALGTSVIITSSSDEKLARARALGADHVINYAARPDWDRAVLDITDGLGADVTVENGGGGTLEQSIRATRAGGCVALLGAVTGLQATLNVGAWMMKRIRVEGVMVDNKTALLEMLAFAAHSSIRPVIDRRFDFDELPRALQELERGGHFGKLVLTRDA